MAAAGNSSAPRSYQLLDHNVPTTGTLRYYRLHQTDQDGTSSYSPVAAVRLDHMEEPLTLHALPNPFRADELQARIEAPAAARATLHLLDLAGRTLLTRELQLLAGSTTLALPELAKLPPGVYVLTLHVGTEVRQQKLLKE